MNIQHKELANGRWNELGLLSQMAHVGGEVERSLKWKKKDNNDYCRKAVERALELLDLTLADPKNKSRLKEIARVREGLVDYFFGANQFASTEKAWRSYFSQLTYASRRDC